MKRRTLLLAAVGKSEGVPDTPLNRIAIQSNEMIAAMNAWAKAFNTIKYGQPDVKENDAWHEYMRLVKHTDRKRTAWLRGYK
jgi:hypothetical protein